MLTLPTGRAWSGLRVRLGVGVGTSCQHCSAICRGNQRRLQLCMHTHTHTCPCPRSCPSYLSRICCSACASPAVPPLLLRSRPPRLVSSLNTHTRSTHGQPAPALMSSRPHEGICCARCGTVNPLLLLAPAPAPAPGSCPG